MPVAWVRVSAHVVRVVMTFGRSAIGDRVRRVAMGRTDTGIATARRVVVIDPLNPLTHESLGLAL